MAKPTQEDISADPEWRKLIKPLFLKMYGSGIAALRIDRLRTQANVKVWLDDAPPPEAAQLPTVPVPVAAPRESQRQPRRPRRR